MRSTTPGLARTPCGFLAGFLILALALDIPAQRDSPKPTVPAYRRVLVGDEAKRADELEQQIEDLRKAGKYTAAAGIARTILETRCRRQGQDHWQTADAQRLLQTLERAATFPAKAQADLAESTRLDGEVFGLYQRGKYAQAVPLLQRVLDLRRRHFGEEHHEVAAALNDLAFFLAQSGRYREAEPLYRRALTIFRNILGEAHPTLAASYNNIGANLRDQGRAAEAGPFFQKAIAICLQVLGEEHPSTAASYDNLASALYDQGKYAEAEPYYEQALAIARNVLGPAHPQTATSCNNLALNLHDQGRFAEAELLYRTALAIRIEAQGEEHPETATGYNNLAGSLKNQGKITEAEPLLRKVLRLRCKVLGEEHPLTAASYNNVAGSLQDQGRYAEADLFCQKALALRQKTQGAMHPDTASSYHNLAWIRSAQGKFPEAESLVRKALALRRETLGEAHPDTITSYDSLALILHAQGKYAAAEQSWVDAARTFEVVRLRSGGGGLQRAAFAARHSPFPALTACRARLGKPLLAWDSLEAGLARGLLDELSAPLTPDLSPAERQRQHTLATTLEGLARQVAAVLQVQPQTDQDRVRFQQLVRQRQAAEAELERLAALLSARQVSDRQRIQAQLPADAAWVAWVDPKVLPNAANANAEHWACVLRHRGAPIWVRLPGSGPGGIWTEDDDEVPNRFRLAVSSPPGQFREDLAALRRQVVVQRLAPLEPALRATGTLPTVRQLLVCPVWAMAGVPLEALTDQYTISYMASGSLLVKLVARRPLVSGKAVAPPGLLAVGDPAFAPEPSRTSPHGSPPERGVLIAQILPNSNAAQSGLKSGDVILSYAGAPVADGQDLAKALARKPNPEANQGKRSRDGVPVTAWRQGQTVALVVQPGPLGVRPAAGTAAEALRAQRERERVLRASRGKGHGRLVGTRQEVQVVASLFDQPLVLLDAAASTARLEELARQGELRRFRYLHFATHGEANDRVALQSALILAPDLQPEPAHRTPVNLPELDSRLTAAEMLEWKLDADLVTLSACQSGLGRPAGGEGYLGFAQALFLAGTRSVLVSLWKVDDVATALLMARFYQNLLGKRPELKAPLSKAEALREAKHWLRDLTAAEVEVLQNELRNGRLGAAPVGPRDEEMEAERPYAHPHYWAAFILIGDPH
jgi:tetratricopeptide (TPR) repeat protein